MSDGNGAKAGTRSGGAAVALTGPEAVSELERRWRCSRLDQVCGAAQIRI